MSTPTHAKDTMTQDTLIVAGGCFWCIESDFEKLEGVIGAFSGYIGGTAETATYKHVSHGGTEHYEAIRIVFNPEKITRFELLEYFWRHIDPLDDTGQFCDKGDQYKSAVFARNKEQETEALASKKEAEGILGEKIVTEILRETPFYDAEDYHQDYYKKHPISYAFYRKSCGRDRRVKALWGK